MKIKYFDHLNKLHVHITLLKEQEHCYEHVQSKTGAIAYLVLHCITSGKKWRSQAVQHHKRSRKNSDKRNQLTGMQSEMQTGTSMNEIISKTHCVSFNSNGLQHHYWNMSSNDI